MTLFIYLFDFIFLEREHFLGNKTSLCQGLLSTEVLNVKITAFGYLKSYMGSIKPLEMLLYIYTG